MAEAYDWETREQAQELYVIEGHTYDEVAGLTGVSVSQLKRWSKEERWSDARKEYRQELTSIKRNKVKLRADLLTKAVNSLDPQVVYAFAAAESAAAPKGKQGEEPKVAPVPIADREFESIEELTEALLDAVKHKANVMVSTPGELNHSGVKDLNDTLTLLNKMKEQYGTKKTQRKTVSKAKLKEIKEQVKL